MTKNIRTPRVDFTTEVDPFLEVGLSPDDQTRPINPETEPNGLSRADTRDMSRIFRPDMIRLDRMSAARNQIRSAGDTAERLMENLSSLKVK